MVQGAVRLGRCVAVLCLFASMSGETHADEVLLEDGGRIIGRVKELKRRKLHMRTEHMGTVRIELDSIVELRTDRELTVEVESGEQFTGRLIVAGGLLTIEGAQPMTVAVAVVERIEKPADVFWDRVDLDASGGLNLVRGNSTTTSYRLDAGAVHNPGGQRTRMDLSTSVTAKESDEETRRSTFDLLHEWVATPRWTLDGVLDLESNEAKSLQLRSILSLTPGFRLVRSPGHKLEGLFGVSYISEDFEGESPDGGIAGHLGFSYRLNVGPTRLDALLLHYSTSGSRYLVQFDSKLRIEIVRNLDFDITFYDRFDSEPPVAIEENDYGLTLGLGWSN